MLLVHLQGIFHSGANEGTWPYFYLHLHDFYEINLGKYTVRPMDPYTEMVQFLVVPGSFSKLPKAGHPDWLPVLLDEQGQQESATGRCFFPAGFPRRIF